MSATGELDAISPGAPALPEYETLAVTLDAGVATVYLNRPDKANSMCLPMWGELQACFEWIDSEPAARVAILAARGRHFCSGIDLSLFGGIVGASSR